jgi:hypothetical protein
MAFATNAQLVEVLPTIINHGVTDFTSDLAEAEKDVKRYLEVNWYNKTFSGGYNQVGRSTGSEFDASLLTEAQWTRATVFRALSTHILPSLSPFAVGGDTFREMITFYKARFEEEMDMEMAQGIEYDSDNDGTVAKGEVHRQRADRVYR